MEPPSPIQALGVNTTVISLFSLAPSFLYQCAKPPQETVLFINLIGKGLTYVKQQAASAFMRFKRIIKEDGSIYKSTRERVN